jgi:hypothetical protein
LVEAGYLHDIDYKDEDTGSLLYRKSIICGGNSSGAASYLAINLHKEGKYDAAYLVSLDAYLKDTSDESARNRLIRYADDAGYKDRATHRPVEELEAELNEAKAAGLYPLAITEAEEEEIEACLARRPPIAEATLELSRPVL